MGINNWELMELVQLDASSQPLMGINNPATRDAASRWPSLTTPHGDK